MGTREVTASATANLAEFIRRLQAVRFGVADRETIDQAKCVVFCDGQLLTFNEQVACRVDSGLGADFRGAVKADKLIEMLEKWPDETVEIVQETGQLVITGGRRRRAEFDMEAQVLLPVGAIEAPDDGAWHNLPFDFDEGAALVARCTGRNETRFDTVCVHFTPTHLEACDNAQLMRYEMPMPITESFMLRGSAVKAACNVGAVEFALGERWAHFRAAGGLILSCQRFDDESLKDFDDIIRFDGEEVGLPKGLAEAVQRAAVGSSENPDSDKVTVELRPGKVRVRGNGLTVRFQELKEIKYAGPPMSFMIAPALLGEITEKYDQCVVTDGRLRVDGGKFSYVVSLAPTPEQLVGA